MPPTYNVIISNVPGPRGKLYFLGAEMEAYYPISALAHGQALNITCQSYAGTMDFGFTGCHTSVPSLQRLAVYSAEAVQELFPGTQITFGPATETGERFFTAAQNLSAAARASSSSRSCARCSRCNSAATCSNPSLTST